MNRPQSGFTVVETVVAVALTAVLLGFLLPAYLSAGGIYRSVADANLLQLKSASALGFIKESLQNAQDVRILSGAPQPVEGYSAIWCEDQKLYYQKSGSEPAVYLQDTRFALDMSFAGKKLTIRLQVLTDGAPYTLESKIALQGTSLFTERNGVGIQFKTDPDTSP